MALGSDDACCATARGDDGLTPVSPPYLVPDAEFAHCDLQDFPLTSWGANLARVDDDDVARSRRHRARRCTPGRRRGTAGCLHRGFTRCPLTRDLLRGARLGRGLVPSGLLGLRALGCGLLRSHCSPPYRLLHLQPTSSTSRKAGRCPATRAVPADGPSYRFAHRCCSSSVGNKSPGGVDRVSSTRSRIGGMRGWTTGYPRNVPMIHLMGEEGAGAEGRTGEAEDGRC